MDNASAPIKILIVDDNERARDALIEQLRFADLQVVGESTLGTAAYTWAEHLSVDIVLVAVGEPLARALRTIESLTVGSRTWPVVAISSLGDRDTMRKAMMAGARDFVVQPVQPQELHRAIVEVHAVERYRRTAAATGETGSRLGTIVAVFGVKGGIGKSTVATNVAVSLAQLTNQHVAMLDLDLQFGDAAVLLDLVPQKTIADAARDIERMDPQLITSYLAPHASRLRLLAAPPTPDEADAISAEHVAQVLEALAATNDYVVVDLGAQFDQVSMAALDLATIILIPILPEVTSIRRTRAALTLMQQWGYTRDKVKLVVNRVKRRSEVSLAEVGEVLAYQIYGTIPEDAAVGKANSLGTPIAMSGPKTKAGRAILDLGRRLAGLPEPQRRLFSLRGGKSAPAPSAVSRVLEPAPAQVAAPSLASWALSEGGRPSQPVSHHMPGAYHANGVAAPAAVAQPGGHSEAPPAIDPYSALDQDYWNTLFGPREGRNRIWANLVGPTMPVQEIGAAGAPAPPWSGGAVPGAHPIPPVGQQVMPPAPPMNGVPHPPIAPGQNGAPVQQGVGPLPMSTPGAAD